MGSWFQRFPVSLVRPLKMTAWSLFFFGYATHVVYGGNAMQLAPVIGWTGIPKRPQWLRIGVFQTDAWVESVQDGSLAPQPRFPIVHIGNGLLDGAHFTPEAYLADVRRWLADRQSRCDVLMYYGGRRVGVERQGLNFNSWTAAELHALQAIGGRPFIGLETTDPVLVKELVTGLYRGGFSGSRLFIRIDSEPSGSAYGTDNATADGRRHCAAAYAAYKKRFGATSTLLRHLGQRDGIQFQIVFAGDSAEDFDQYLPDPSLWDALGFDLYLTPANIRRVMPLLQRVLKRFDNRPVVIPEFGVATQGESHDPGFVGVHSTPRWAEAALSQALNVLGHHHGRVTQITLFSVNVAARMPARRWSWAWTPVMFRMLEEWQQSPARWKIPHVSHPLQTAARTNPSLV